MIAGPSKESNRPQAQFDLNARPEKDMIGDGDNED